jgi:oxygen-dependent protoporphyrinogen oxidase
VEEKDFIMESGADSIVARNEHVMPLVKDLNLEDEQRLNPPLTP